MTKGEIEAIRNIVARLKKPNLGCSHGPATEKAINDIFGHRQGSNKLEVASRIYLDTWVIPSLEMLLPGEGRNVELAASMSR